MNETIATTIGNQPPAPTAKWSERHRNVLSTVSRLVWMVVGIVPSIAVFAIVVLAVERHDLGVVPMLGFLFFGLYMFTTGLFLSLIAGCVLDLAGKYGPPNSLPDKQTKKEL